jgi:hypothetical protein
MEDIYKNIKFDELKEIANNFLHSGINLENLNDEHKDY